MFWALGISKCHNACLDLDVVIVIRLGIINIKLEFKNIYNFSLEILCPFLARSLENRCYLPVRRLEKGEEK